ncbi:hypothetical protein DPMN_037429 [Dreissena polymorpha]|uniref:Uncharacterized protein n=1 Tax=Dreissena polymorpha TaxID=45954 RepID=A0A9D4RPU3_DREPO|nr:hypothetical protein DPMN_037429 [Dreissena polymorpha]
MVTCSRLKRRLPNEDDDGRSEKLLVLGLPVTSGAMPPCRVVPGLRHSCDGTMLHDVEPMGWTQMPDGMTMLSCYPVRGRVQTCSLSRRRQQTSISLEVCTAEDDVCHPDKVYSRCLCDHVV